MSARRPRSVFLTGATGVVGRLAVPQLVAAGCRVVAMGRSGRKRAALEEMGAQAVAVDLLDAAAVRRAVAEACPEVIVHLATHIPPTPLAMMFPGAWRENDRLRREASSHLVDAALAAGASIYVQESFAPIYEDAGERWIDESFPVRPARTNRTVLDAERSAERFTAGGGRGVVLRFAYFYGPDAMLASMAAAARGGRSPLPGRFDDFVSHVAHADAASAVVAAVTAGELAAGTYNVVDDEPLRRGEFARAIASLVGAPEPRPLPGWLVRLGGEPLALLARSQRMSNAKLRGATAWRPRWPNAREGLREALRSLP